jgi:hypothetical protein
MFELGEKDLPHDLVARRAPPALQKPHRGMAKAILRSWLCHIRRSRPLPLDLGSRSRTQSALLVAVISPDGWIAPARTEAEQPSFLAYFIRTQITESCT